MIRLLVRTVVALLSTAVGLIVAALLIDDFNLSVTGFVVAVVVFTIAFALMQPFLAVQLRRAPAAVLGGVSLIATLVSLVVTVLLTDGLSIDSASAWILGTLVVWLAALLAGVILPLLGLKKYLGERRA
jgi:MFS-type transporter involved in bile tolerance (Atg22 family)